MKDYLVKHTVANQLVFPEIDAIHTLDNFTNSKAIMDQKKIQPKNIYIITHEWHMDRSKALADFIFIDTKIEKLIYKGIPSQEKSKEVLERIKKKKKKA